MIAPFLRRFLVVIESASWRGEALTRRFTMSSSSSSSPTHANRKASLTLLGCFNPPTVAHLRLLLEAKIHIEKKGNIQFAEAVLSPCSDGYAKPTLISSKHRLEMCRLALDEMNNWPGQESDPPMFRLSSAEA